MRVQQEPLSGLTVNQNHTTYNGIVIEPGVWSVGGTLTNAGCPYVLTDSMVMSSGLTLDLDPGVIVKSRMGGFQVQDIHVNGTTSQPVILTSLADDSVSGDTNKDGPSDGMAGDWGGIGISSSPGSTISNARISFATQAVFLDNSSCSFDRLFCRKNDQTLFFGPGTGGTVTNSDFLGNYTAVYVDAASTADLGNLNDSDPLNDGLNQFVCNDIAVRNDGASALPAENNWWGKNPPSPAIFSGSVDYDPYLHTEIPHRKLLSALELDVQSASNIHLRWEDLGISCGYRMFRSDKPDRDFIDISGPLSNNEFTDAGAASGEGVLFYVVDID